MDTSPSSEPNVVVGNPATQKIVFVTVGIFLVVALILGLYVTNRPQNRGASAEDLELIPLEKCIAEGGYGSPIACDLTIEELLGMIRQEEPQMWCCRTLPIPTIMNPTADPGGGSGGSGPIIDNGGSSGGSFCESVPNPIIEINQ